MTGPSAFSASRTASRPSTPGCNPVTSALALEGASHPPLAAHGDGPAGRPGRPHGAALRRVLAGVSSRRRGPGSTTSSATSSAARSTWCTPTRTGDPAPRVAFNREALPDEMARLADALGVPGATRRALWDLAVASHVPTSLADLGLREEDLPEAAHRAAAEITVNPAPVDEAAGRSARASLRGRPALGGPHGRPAEATARAADRRAGAGHSTGQLALHAPAGARSDVASSSSRPANRLAGTGMLTAVTIPTPVATVQPTAQIPMSFSSRSHARPVSRASSSSARSTSRLVIVWHVSRRNRAGRSLRTSASSRVASNALPLAVECSGNETPTADTVCSRWGRATWSMNTTWSPDSTARSTVSRSRSDKATSSGGPGPPATAVRWRSAAAPVRGGSRPTLIPARPGPRPRAP